MKVTKLSNIENSGIQTVVYDYLVYMSGKSSIELYNNFFAVLVCIICFMRRVSFLSTIFDFRFECVMIF